jgi:hypothetical protein
MFFLVLAGKYWDIFLRNAGEPRSAQPAVHPYILVACVLLRNLSKFNFISLHCVSGEGQYRH